MKLMMSEQWASYLERVMPADAGAVQVQECRRAFYAGAQALFCGVLAMLDPTTDDATPEDEMKMTALQDELEQFARDVAQGRA